MQLFCGVNDSPTFLWSENFRHGATFWESHGCQGWPITWDGDAIKKLDGSQDRADRIESELLATVQQVLSHLLFRESIGQRVKRFGKFGDSGPVSINGIRAFSVEY